MNNRHRRPNARSARPGFTLVEVLIATTITLVLMGLIVQIFAMVGATVSETRSTIQMVDRLRTARQVMQSDLSGVTCAGMTPPLDPKMGMGYIEIVEGPIGSRFFPSAAPMAIVTPNGTPVGTTSLSTTSPLPPGDTSLGDIDDMIMFTTTTQGDPFVGSFFFTQISPPKHTTTTSDVAEVCYFLRGTTLFRRSLLVKPGHSVWTPLPQSSGNPAPPFYAMNDISVRQEGGPFDHSPNPVNPGFPRPVRLVANSLGDLTKRENRYGHQPFAFPYDARFWGPLGLPTLRECSYFHGASLVDVSTGTWPFPLFDPVNYPGVWAATSSNLTGTYVFPSPPNPPQLYSTVPGGGNSLNVFPQIPQINLTLSQGGVFDAWPNALTISPTGGFQTPFPWDQTTFPVGAASNPFAPNTDPNGAIYGFSASNTPTAMQPAGNARFTEDVILTNVISFDVKIWDDDAPVVGHPGLDGLPGVAAFDDDHDGTVDNLSELGAAGSDDIVWQPGDVYPDAMLPANLQGFSNFGYNYTAGLTSTTPPNNNWANMQYLTAYQLTTLPTPQAWVIQKGAYVDLAYAQNPLVGATVGPTLTNPFTPFCGPGDFRSQLWAGGWFNNGGGNNFYVMPAVYDTGSTSYEDDGLDEDAITVGAFGTSSYGPDQGTNGLDDNQCAGPDDISGEPFRDNNNNGLKDGGDTFIPNNPLWDLNNNGIYDPPETELPPPYRTKLKGVQIRIRVFEPDSRQIREVTIVQEFENE